MGLGRRDRDPGGGSGTLVAVRAVSRANDVEGGQGPGHGGGAGARRTGGRARWADAKMRWAMSGEVENGDGKPVDPSLEGVRKPCRVTDILTFVG